MEESRQDRTYSIGVDVGGTFTDVVLVDENSGRTWIEKVPTTPDIAEGVGEGLVNVLRDAKAQPSQVRSLIHGTTVATNALIQRRGARVALVTTQGFEDVLEIGRQRRPDLYDLFQDKPQQLISREMVFGVPERVTFEGEVLKSLDMAQLEETVREISSSGVEAVAVSLLHSYANPDNEQKVGKAVARHMPGTFVALSSEILPEFREYERTSTTAIAAYLGPLVSKYLELFAMRLEKLGLGSKIFIMQSNGGTATAESAKKRVVPMVESGPAAGMMAAAYVGSLVEVSNLVSFDMGGTTAKAGLVLDGRPGTVSSLEVGGEAHAFSLLGGRGLPLKHPSCDMTEVGAGGGSIAWIDPGIKLRVGPRSAGSNPGPVAYDMGGEEPTVTDADLILGYLNPDYFLGGKLRLNMEKAKRSIQEKIARPLEMDLIRAAYGINEIVNATMASAIRLVSLMRGHDPRDLALVAFGGAGPAHAVRLAQELGIPKVIVPEHPGLTSAVGLLIANLRHDYVRTKLMRTDQAQIGEIKKIYRELEEHALTELEGEGVNREAVTILHSADVRYLGQSYELNIPFPDGGASDKSLSLLEGAFHEAHTKTYGHSAPEEPVQIVNLKVTSLGSSQKPSGLFRANIKGRGGSKKAIRQVFFKEYQDYAACDIYERNDIGPKIQIEGPVIVEELDSTTVIPPKTHFEVDSYGNIIVELREG